MSGQGWFYRYCHIFVFTALAAFLHGCTASTPSTPADSTALKISVNSLPAAQTGAAYSVVIGVSGGSAPYSWSIMAGSLPAGLALNTSSGLISGTPTVPGNQ